MMKTKELIALRLHNQHLSRHGFQKPEEIVRWMGAMQAQDYAGAKWSIGLRLDNATETDIEQAISRREIVRTWPMRGTLHFVSAGDLRWMLKLLAPRIISSLAGRQRQLEMDGLVLKRSKKLVISALSGGKQLQRREIFQLLEKAKIPTTGQRGIHILQQFALEGLVCLASHQGKQPSFALLDEWLKPTTALDPDEALRELTIRYFLGHGPARPQDFAWWSGLKLTDVKTGLLLAGSHLKSVSCDQTIYWMAPDLAPMARSHPRPLLLPGFDEYMLGYADRTQILEGEHQQKIVPGNNGMFMSTLVLGGRIGGTWKKSIKKQELAVELSPFQALEKGQESAIHRLVKRYAAFLGLQVAPC